MSVNAKETIQTYLFNTGLTQRDLALKCRITPEGLSRALKKNGLSALLAFKIHHYTQGRIKYEDLTEEPFPKKKKRGS